MRCNRCDWRATRGLDLGPDEQLAAHSLAAAHPLCICCQRSLSDDDVQTCAACLDTARAHLAGIRTCYDELPLHLGHPKAPSLDSGARTDDGHPLPGGDVLVLLGPGSEGLSEDGATTRDGDVGSVAFELHYWASDFRERWGETDSPPPLSTSAQVRRNHGYLERRMWRAATTHPGFDQFAGDLRRLHRSLQGATARLDAHESADAPCLECQCPLVRGVSDSGYQDGFTCTGCGRAYDVQPGGYNAYAIALSDHLQRNPQEWASADLLYGWYAVTPGLLRQWAHRGQVQSRRSYDMTLYRVEDVRERVEAMSA